MSAQYIAALLNLDFTSKKLKDFLDQMTETVKITKLEIYPPMAYQRAGPAKDPVKLCRSLNYFPLSKKLIRITGTVMCSISVA